MCAEAGTQQRQDPVQRRIKAVAGENAELDGKQQHQQQAQPEGRDRGYNQRNHAERVVKERILLDRKQNSERNGDQIRQNQRAEGQNTCGGQADSDHLGDRLLGRIGNAQIACHQALHVVHILNQNRLIQTIFMVEGLDLLRLRVHAERQTRRVAGAETEHQENDDRHAQQDRDHLNDALEYIFDHGAAPL